MLNTHAFAPPHPDLRTHEAFTEAVYHSRRDWTLFGLVNHNHRETNMMNKERMPETDIPHGNSIHEQRNLPANMFPQTPSLTLILAGQTHSFLWFLPITQTVKSKPQPQPQPQPQPPITSSLTDPAIKTHSNPHQPSNDAYFQPHEPPPPAIPIPIRPRPHFRPRPPCHNLLSNQRLQHRNFR